MDVRLQQALEYANYKTTVFVQKQNLQLRMENSLKYAVNGGAFNIDQTLISFIDVLIKKDLNSAIIIDSRNNPVRITDLLEFQNSIVSLYFEATNEYFHNMEILRKARSVAQAIGS